MKKRILCTGDIVGKPGRKMMMERLPAYRREREIDFVVANGENAAAGSGITTKIVNSLLNAGVDVITTGDHIYKNKEVFACIDHEQLLRPHNYVPTAAGKGVVIRTLAEGTRIGVINLQGRVFMEPAECPFHAVDKLLDELQDQTDLLILDFHAEASSEKIAMGWYLDGRVTAVVGTHTHVQTADERILPQGTAYITDLGMTGPYDSILGRDKERVLQKFTTQMPARFDIASDDVRICGVEIEVDLETGRAVGIERVNLICDAGESHA
ncbi:MAG: TIGR00282 family metallophosphoesterase [Planctomycetota bacterium]|jgi:metallophosphoesterase (TIGR00282 family)